MNRHRLATVEAAREFALAGSARLTLVSARTGVRFTYRLRAKGGPENLLGPWFVGVLTGPDNESHFEFLGTVFLQETEYRHGRRSRIGSEAPSAVAFRWFWGLLLGLHGPGQDALPDSLEVWHEGRCGRCGRALTVPQSIERGIGPECAGIQRREARQFELGLKEEEARP